MTDKHTPAPWEASDRGDYSDFDGDSVVITGDDRRICAVHHSGSDEAQANAHLIKAAPEMIDALKALDESWLGTFSNGPEWEDPKGIISLHDEHRELWRNIKKAIAKASGE